MSDPKPADQTPFADCPHWGKGGRYTVVDGARVLVERKPEAGNAGGNSANGASSAAATEQPVKKGSK